MNILSLDGGGVRGYLTTIMLEKIEQQLSERDGKNVSIHEYFDLIVGTSTGAIIAGLLAIGKTSREVKKIYEREINNIFSYDMKRYKCSYFPFNKLPFPLFKAKYNNLQLEEVAKKYFGNLTFKYGTDIKTHLLITSVDITTMNPRFHKSAYHPKNKGREDELLADAIIASASAPTYFPVKKKLKHSSYLIDGGIVANNPSLVALIDGISDHLSGEKITLLSIGTGKINEIPYNYDKLYDTTIKWLRQNGTSPLIEILINSQTILAEYQTSFLMDKLGYKEYYLRINPSLGTRVELDSITKIDVLKNLADLNQEQVEWIRKKITKEKK